MKIAPHQTPPASTFKRRILEGAAVLTVMVPLFFVGFSRIGAIQAQASGSLAVSSVQPMPSPEVAHARH